MAANNIIWTHRHAAEQSSEAKKIAHRPQRFKIVNEALKIKHHTIHAWLHRIILACVWCVCVVWLHNQTHSRRPLFSIGINWMGTPGLFVKCQIDTWKPQLLPSSYTHTAHTLWKYDNTIEWNTIWFFCIAFNIAQYSNRMCHFHRYRNLLTPIKYQFLVLIVCVCVWYAWVSAMSYPRDIYAVLNQTNIDSYIDDDRVPQVDRHYY